MLQKKPSPGPPIVGSQITIEGKTYVVVAQTDLGAVELKEEKKVTLEAPPTKRTGWLSRLWILFVQHARALFG